MGEMLPLGWNEPAPASKEALVDVLQDALERVRVDDSFEGFVQWCMPDPDDPAMAGADFALMARYRAGNLEGQGFVRVFHEDRSGQ